MKKIPLLIAILMSINIVVGGGFFLSASNIFQLSGLLAPLTWVFCGLLLLPLVIVLSHMSNLYPTAGGIYVFSRQNLGEFWGFLSGWVYFIGTLAGNAMVLYAFGALLKDMGFAPAFLTQHFAPQTSLLIINIFFITAFSLLNMLNITIFEKMHIGFTILKTIPIGLVIISMFFLFKPANFYTAPVQPLGIFKSMPIVLFAYLGIEACCAMAHAIKDGERNSSRAMLISIGIIIAIYSITQFGLLGIVGVQSKNPFLEIIPQFTSNPVAIHWGNTIVKIAILSSYLGGFYGMYYANSWNLYALAKEKTLLFSEKLTVLNKYNTPWACIITQGVIAAILLAISATSNLTLMIMSGFGVVIAYMLSTVAYFIVGPKNKVIIGTLSLVGCTALLILCFNDLAQSGMRYLLPFLAILISGLVLYKIKKRHSPLKRHSPR